MIAERDTILVVSNPDETQNLLLEYLRGSGFKVPLATDGETALEMARFSPPDIILLDVKLPGIDGFETCRRLKAQRETADIPLIFITSQTGTIDKVRGFVLGAVDYITRPIQSEEVLARVKTHLTLQRLQKEAVARNAMLQAEIAEREKLIEELDAFAHTVAHDLKNPLGVTITHTQFLQKFHAQMSPPELRDGLDTIVKNGRKMNNIIDELLLLSSVRIEEVTPQPLHMADVVLEALDRLGFLIDEYQAAISSPAPESWPVVLAYAPWVEEVWINYISNAIKYGGPRPNIALGAHTGGDGLVEFWVRDHGPGLSVEEQARLFVPFNRLNQVRAEGHGLGLSIVQRIVSKLGGRVTVTSAPGQGSTFSFFLPQA
ncbi:MAG: response regulator [Anaerolineae bacterium]